MNKKMFKACMKALSNLNEVCAASDDDFVIQESLALFMTVLASVKKSFSNISGVDEILYKWLDYKKNSQKNDCIIIGTEVDENISIYNLNDLYDYLTNYMSNNGKYYV